MERKCCLIYIFRILSWRARGRLKSQRNAGNGCDITFLYYFGLDKETDQLTSRRILQLSTLSFKRFVYKGKTGDRYHGFVSRARNESTEY